MCTAAVTAARACPAEIGVARSSYLWSLKDDPQTCEMGCDMSSSSSSIRHLSGKLPGEEEGVGTRDVNFRFVYMFVLFVSVNTAPDPHGMYVFMIFFWQEIWV